MHLPGGTFLKKGYFSNSFPETLVLNMRLIGLPTSLKSTLSENDYKICRIAE